MEKIDSWKKNRDAYDGQDAIHSGGEIYLPKLSGQSVKEYKAYKLRALFYAITAKSISSMVGMATYKQPTLVFPDAMAPYFQEDSSIQFYELYTQALIEIILQGRCGIFIDRPQQNALPMTYVYTAESIVNWMVDDNGMATMVVLEEVHSEVDESDPYNITEVIRYRELAMDDLGSYAQMYDAKGQAITGRKYFTVRGVNLQKIPFYCLGPSGLNYDVSKSPSQDVVNINLSHYRTSADLEHGRHFTALPTPVVIGADGTTTSLHIGSITAWGIPLGGDAKFLEFTGQGLKSLEVALKEKETQLASLSARLLDNSTRGSEAAESVKLRYMSETATLTSIVRAMESMLNRVYKDIALFESLDPTTVSVGLDKDFISSTITHNELKEMAAMYLSGTMSPESYIYNLRKGGRLDPNRTDKEELDNLPTRLVIN